MIPRSTPSGLRYALLVSDFDGTICDANWYVAPEVAAAMAEFQGAGGVISIATGRPYYGILRTFMQEHAITAPAVVHGGAKVVDPVTGESIWSLPIPPEAMVRIVSFLEAHEPVFRYTIEQEDRVAMETAFARQVFGDDVPAVPHEQWTEQPVYKCVVGVRKLSDVHKLQEAEVFFRSIPELSVYPSSGKAGPILDLTAVGADKQTGGIRLLEHLGFSTDQVMFAGDGGNDIPLLQIGGLKVAAGYGPAELRKLAHTVIENDDHQMIARLLEEYAYSD